MRSIVLAISLVLMGACTGSTAGDQATTTAAIGPQQYSPEAAEAIRRCADELGPTFGPEVEIDATFGNTFTLDDAIATCDQAQVQLADDDQLLAPLQDLIRYLSLTALSVMTGGFTGGEQARLQSQCDEFTQLVDDALHQSD